MEHGPLVPGILEAGQSHGRLSPPAFRRSAALLKPRLWTWSTVSFCCCKQPSLVVCQPQQANAQCQGTETPLTQWRETHSLTSSVSLVHLQQLPANLSCGWLYITKALIFPLGSTDIISLVMFVNPSLQPFLFSFNKKTVLENSITSYKDH